MVVQPTGTVTLLFTDVEGSTLLLERLGAERFAETLALHRRVLREAFARHGGYEVDEEGDAFLVAFQAAGEAVAAAREAQQGLASVEWPSEGGLRVRMGVHTGEPLPVPPKYVGMDVHRAARIMAAGHGGQVLVSETTAALLDGTPLRDLGPHRLKDMLQPIRLYQLEVDGLPGEFPPLRSLRQTNLPVPGTPFIGREQDLRDLSGLLSADEARVVTVTGPGGVGKTRLVLQAAAAVSDRFPDGVFWIALAPLRAESLLAATFAQALEVVEQPDRTVAESVIAALAGKQALLVVDNCEHLLEPVANFVGELIESSPHLVVACSSRERLGLRVEGLFPVPPLTESDGMSLFAERARAVEPSFVSDEHVAAICTAVDELPLAIELAAARVRSLSTAAIRERLAVRLPLLVSRDRDRDERQRTLEAAIAWSYDLLDPDEQRVLRALSVFAGGCTLEAIETVAAADLDLLESLLDKSLVRYRIDEAGGDRYWLLETIREYAAARLDEEEESDVVRARHRNYFCERASKLGGDRLVPPPENLARYDADRANFRVVFTEALACQDSGIAIRLVASLVGLWLSAGEAADNYEPARAALALPGADERDRGWALDRTAMIADELGRYEEAQRLYAQANENALRRGDPLLACEVSRHHASMFGRMGDYEQAIEWAQRSVELARELGSDELEERSLGTQLAVMIAAATDREHPEIATLERCLAIAQQLEPRWIASGNDWMAHDQLAAILFYLGRYTEALPHARAYLRHFGHTSQRTADSVLLVAYILGGLGHHQTAVTLASAAHRLNDEQGWDRTSTDRRVGQRFEAEARQAIAAGTYEAAARAGKELSVEQTYELALDYPNRA